MPALKRITYMPATTDVPTRTVCGYAQDTLLILRVPQGVACETMHLWFEYLWGSQTRIEMCNEWL